MFMWHDFTPGFTAKVSDDLYGFMDFRIRQAVWGNAGMGEEGIWWGDNSMQYYITRYKSSWYLDHLYMDFRIPGQPIRMRLGRYWENSPKGIIMGGDISWPGIRVTAEIGDVATTNLHFFKRREAMAISSTMGWDTGIRESDDDIDVWAWNLVVTPTPESSIGLYVYYQDAGDVQNWYWDGSQVTWIDLQGIYRSGPITVNADFLFDFGDYDQGECSFKDVVDGACAPGSARGREGDISGFAMDLRLTYDAPWATLGLIFAFSTGDDDLTDNDMDGFIGLVPWYTPTNLMFAGRYDWFMLRSSGLGANGASVALGWQNQCQFGTYCDLNDYNGMTLVQVSIGKAFTPKFTADANLTFMWSTEDGYYPGSPIHEYTDPVTGVVHANTDKTLGSEVDINATYKVYDQLTWFFESGVMFPGDYYRYLDGDPDDPDTAWELQTGLFYTW